MLTIEGFEVFPLDFDRTGAPVQGAQLQAILDAIPGRYTDFLVLSHGWNNDTADADALYAELLKSMRSLIPGAHALKDREIAVCTIHWPSKRFAESDLIPGGVASADGAGYAFLTKQLQDLRRLFDGSDEQHSPPDPDVVLTIDRLIALLPRLEIDEESQDAFGRLFRSIMSPKANEEEPTLPGTFYTLSGADLLNRFSRTVVDKNLASGGLAQVSNSFPDGAAEGGPASLGNLFTGIKNGVQNFLNLFTYYEMKERAGTIGAGGVHRALLQVQAKCPLLRLHLAGHSFGGRLVTAALASESDGRLKVSSICLLQAAFSHYGFSLNYDGRNNGFFRGALLDTHLNGPMAVTFSANDKAVGIAYPIASRLRDQIAADLGDASDPYGGIGRNGAQKTPESVVFEMPDTTTPYPGNLVSGKILNVKADAYVKGHSDVRNPQVAHMVLSAIETQG
jgi:hypothetical protein